MGLLPRVRQYAARLGNWQLLDGGAFPVVLGGDCSILLGVALALRRRGRHGLAFIDGHSDFRHLGNAPAVGAAAGEDLALVTGRGQDDLVDIDGLRPYVRGADVVVLGIRDDDECRDELAALAIQTAVATACQAAPAPVAGEALERLTQPHLAGYWLHLDIDVLNPAVMPAVDSPDPGGLDWPDLEALLQPILAHPAALGLQITVFDPDLDPDGHLAATLADVLVDALRRV